MLYTKENLNLVFTATRNRFTVAHENEEHLLNKTTLIISRCHFRSLSASESNANMRNK